MDADREFPSDIAARARDVVELDCKIIGTSAVVKLILSRCRLSLNDGGNFLTAFPAMSFDVDFETFLRLGRRAKNRASVFVASFCFFSLFLDIVLFLFVDQGTIYFGQLTTPLLNKYEGNTSA